MKMLTTALPLCSNVRAPPARNPAGAPAADSPMAPMLLLAKMPLIPLMLPPSSLLHIGFKP
jgi:hypothetical protein